MGGNAAGIFIHSVQSDSLAYHAGLRTGDQILEYNGTDLRSATAEEAAYELARPADKVTVLAHYRIDSECLIYLVRCYCAVISILQNIRRLKTVLVIVYTCAAVLIVAAMS